MKQQVELAEARAKAEAAARERGPSSEPTDLERMRRLQRENTEVKVRQEKLLEEIDDVRNENEALRQQLGGAGTPSSWTRRCSFAQWICAYSAAAAQPFLSNSGSFVMASDILQSLQAHARR